MLEDVTGPQQRDLHIHPIILTSSCGRHNTLSIKGKNLKYLPPPPTLYHGGGMSLHVHPIKG